MALICYSYKAPYVVITSLWFALDETDNEVILVLIINLHKVSPSVLPTGRLCRCVVSCYIVGQHVAVVFVNGEGFCEI